MLAFVLPHIDGDAGGDVFEPDGGTDLVDVLSAGAARAADMLDNIVWINLDIDFLRFRQYRDGGRGGVNSALGLGFRDPLDAMAAAFKLKGRPYAGAFDVENYFAKTAAFGGAEIELFDLPFPVGGVFDVHIVKVSCEKGGLVAAGAGPDFHNDRIDGHLVAHQQGIEQFIEEFIFLFFELARFHLWPAS